MMNNRGLIGWVVAGVLAVALGGVIIYEATSGGDTRSAAIGGSGQGQGPPADVAADVNAILDAKNKAGKDKLPPIPPGQDPTRMENNPPQRCDPNAEPNAIAEWANHAHSLNQAKGMSDAVILGEVQTVDAGAPFIAKVDGEPGGVVETPVQNVTIKVEKSAKGNNKEGDVVTIQRLGDAAGCFRVVGDPPYARGERYLLMLEDGKGGRPPHAFAPEGRYKVHPDGALEAVTKNPVAEEVASDKVEAVLAKLRG